MYRECWNKFINQSYGAIPTKNKIKPPGIKPPNCHIKPDSRLISFRTITIIHVSSVIYIPYDTLLYIYNE